MKFKCNSVALSDRINERVNVRNEKNEKSLRKVPVALAQRSFEFHSERLIDTILEERFDSRITSYFTDHLWEGMQKPSKDKTLVQ